jgi:TonB family protein
MSSGLMIVIGSDRDGAFGSAGADLLAPGGVDSDMDEVLKTVSGMKLAGAGETGSSLRTLADSAGGGKVADITAIRVAQADVDLESESAKETKVKGKAKAGAGEEVGGTGLLDAAEVARVVKSRITAIQMCYQKGLNKNYGLEGKIKVRFTIGTSGRVTKASIEENTLGDPEVGACVLDKVQSFAFSKPEGGSVDYVFPFVFKPAN